MVENKEKISLDVVMDKPLLPLRDVVVYPHMVIPLFVGREKSKLALEEAMSDDKKILLSSQKRSDIDDPSIKDVNTVGTLANILQLVTLPDGTVKLLVEGVSRVDLLDIRSDDFFKADYCPLDEFGDESDKDIQALRRTMISQVESYVRMTKKVPAEVVNTLASIKESGRLVDTIVAHMSLKLDEKQKILEQINIKERLEYVIGLIEVEIDMIEVEQKVRGRVKDQMEKSQKEYYLNEQMKAIQKELGDLDNANNEFDELEEKIKQSGMTKEADEKASSELKKLQMMSPMSAEATVVRNFLDVLLSAPWKKKTKAKVSLDKAHEILDEDHYGLKTVKERIIEYLAVQKRVKKLKGPILCLVGPPGVGKTSLGASIARATGRKFVRMSLGGVRDEAEIRGHRRTYIGAMPGKIMQNLNKVGVRNPLFLLDEIDKMSMDFRGDPSSALLEVLDPEQNTTFNDHYMEVDFDLSDVMFICTANTLNIPPPLLDRMEVIRIEGYTEDEKMNIAEKYLVKKQTEANGLKDSEIKITNSAILSIIRHYTREAGVRNLDREIAKISRKVVKSLVMKSKDETVHIRPGSLDKYLGVQKFKYGIAEKDNQIGQVTGLAWTQVGGELLTIESTAIPGKGKLINTGQLGDVMKESIQAATTVVRSRSKALGIKEDFHQKMDMHIHVPEGATPKDGPSAGIGMCTALISSLTDIPVKANVAMTGEITLRGEVLPIGGLKEKLLAAHRGGIEVVIIPEENKKDLTEIPKNIKDKLEIIPVQWIDQVLEIALERMPEIKLEGSKSSQSSKSKSSSEKNLPH
ncbi:MAG TPA: endopeptidase La [Gammaproteobacteria bacterium]|nr:endopeptidase La [Gammaproteobacteria bacterium]|tara:strand:- start:57 stop:2474 length:2418 start_codon:yes stop_codon:yes gene_type:complete